MTSSRPYLLRALYEWIVDNQLTPHLLVDAMQDDVLVPVQYVEDGRIVLNISSHATHELQMSNDAVSFSARFSGVDTSVFVPMKAVMAIYARENGQGMMFADEGEDGGDSPPTGSEPDGKKPTLTVVK
jgi:stringent starvation protein B